MAIGGLGKTYPRDCSITGFSLNHQAPNHLELACIGRHILIYLKIGARLATRQLEAALMIPCVPRSL